ncbi:hypothetical protein CCHOA_07325 [Corynebacterium choanae]|uniref:Uncharacterized protein n=1 Tax=Corynebacterium choanae TaxID=1862358 RepID=A0A3G6J712_9CORY|nr:hypothetical protein CCHOA_07325 [Corynebacterium choanae]
MWSAGCRGTRRFEQLGECGCWLIVQGNIVPAAVSFPPLPAWCMLTVCRQVGVGMRHGTVAEVPMCKGSAVKRGALSTPRFSQCCAQLGVANGGKQCSVQGSF